MGTPKSTYLRGTDTVYSHSGHLDLGVGTDIRLFRLVVICRFGGLPILANMDFSTIFSSGFASVDLIGPINPREVAIFLNSLL